MNELTCGCEYVDSLILSFCPAHAYPGPESHKDGKGIIIRDLESQNAKLSAEVERLKGPFTCSHPPEYAGGACAVCHCEWMGKANQLELQISAMVAENEKMMLERNGFSEKADIAERLNASMKKALEKIRDYIDTDYPMLSRAREMAVEGIAEKRSS